MRALLDGYGPSQRTPDPVRDRSKKARILELLRPINGATLAELMAATEWQAQSIRGFINGNLTKKMGLTSSR